jgi:hypothetical protein
VFPVGETLKVWLGGAADEEPFRAAVASIAPALTVQRLRPSLHDVALRDLAFAEGLNDGRTARQRH